MPKAIDVRLTGYWPFVEGLSDKERLMEGGHNDRAGNPLYTLEAFQRGEAPYVSVAGDDAVWPYGQRIEIDAWPGVIFRVVDTGGNFRGEGKLYRIEGREPLDVCVDSSRTTVPKLARATVVEGDILRAIRGHADVRWEGVRGQTPVEVDGAGWEAAMAVETVDATETRLDDSDAIVILMIVAGLGALLMWS